MFPTSTVSGDPCWLWVALRYNRRVDANNYIELLNLLASRLERLPADSHYARRASGLRGNIIKVLEEAHAGSFIAESRLALLTDTAFEILRKAAEDIPDIDAILKKNDHKTL